jgi:hypothetical protein
VHASPVVIFDEIGKKQSRQEGEEGVIVACTYLNFWKLEHFDVDDK